VLVIHDWRGPDGDEAYRIGSERREENKALYEQRRAAGFPDDFPRILESRNDE
jgi:hypothetical protein